MQLASNNTSYENQRTWYANEFTSESAVTAVSAQNLSARYLV
jgi:hypothetical protein